MKKLRIIGLFAGMAAIVLILNMLIDPVALSRAKRVNNRNRNYAGILATEENMDVLIFGDSESYTSVSPLQLWQEHGIPAYNGGVQGQCLAETWSEMSTVLKQQHPKVILMETCMLFRYHGIEKDSQMVLAEHLYEALPGLRYHSFWKSIFYTDQDKKKENDWQKGFHLVSGIGGLEDANREEDTKKEAKMAKLNRWYLDRLIALCKENDIQLVLYSAPSPRNYTPARLDFLDMLVQEKGLDYINMNAIEEEIGLDWSVDSYDGGDHLNLSGAQKVTTYIGDKLAQEYQLPDRSSEEEYRQWNQDAEEYAKRVKKARKKWKKNKKAAGTIGEGVNP